MKGMDGEECPFEFNFDPATFKAGDYVSFRIPGHFGEMPFVGTILDVFDDYIEINSEPDDPLQRLRATRESRPIVDDWRG